MNIVASSGLFERKWYAASHPESLPDPVVHFCRDGWRQGLQPNPYFDPAWYAKTYGAELGPDENPLLHYIRRGERENAWPSPHFDPEWYREQYAIGEQQSPLRHYLLNRFAGTHAPLPLFDVTAFVESNPAGAETEQDPYQQWLKQARETIVSPPASESPYASVLSVLGGDIEGGATPDSVPWKTFKNVLRLFVPLIPFDEAWYCKHYPDVFTAVKSGVITSAHGHFIDYGFFEGRSPGAPGRAWFEHS